MTKQSCVFYNKSFFDDLYPYTFYTKDDKYYIQYTVGDKKIDKEVILNISSLNLNNSLIKQNFDAWAPVILTQDDSKNTINNNYLSSGFTLLSKNIGIESVISFDPLFQNWEINQDSCKMNTDWILTSPDNPFSPQYGLMCWTKNPNDYKDDNILDLTIDKVAYNTVIYPKKSWTYIFENEDKQKITYVIEPTTKLIKKSNNILLIVDNDKLITTNNRIAPNTTPKYFLIDELLSYLNSQNQQKETLIDDILFTTKNPKKLIHISHGDVYSYFDSDADASVSISEGIPSKTYLSPILNDIYRQIYHNLTLKYKKEFDFENKIPKPIFNRTQDRLFKKLCYFLCTHPQIDRTTVSILQNPEITNIVDEYINYVDTAIPEHKQLIKVLAKISGYFSKILTDDNIYKDSTYLIKSLISKYGSCLRFKQNSKSKLKYKKILDDGPHLKVRSDITSLCPKNLENEIVFNNVKITAGQYVVQTIINTNESTLKLSTNFASDSSSIPLWDIKKVELKDTKALFTTGPDIEIDFKEPQSNQDFDVSLNGKTELVIIPRSAGLLFTQNESALAGIDISFQWSKISGSNCLRFSNNSITTIRNNGLFVGNTGSSLRFETSQDEQPTIYIKKPGKYTVRCRVSTPFGVITDTINFYITSNDPDFGIYSRPKREVPRKSRQINLIAANNNIIMTPNIKEFCIGKQGIFWPVYSDLSILEPRYISIPNPALPGVMTRRKIGNQVKLLGSLLNKFLIPYDRSDSVYKDLAEGKNSDSFLEFDFDTKNTFVEIRQIVLSNLYSDSHPNCETIYREVFDQDLVDLELAASKTVVEPKTEKEVDIVRPQTIGVKEFTLSSPSGDLLKEKLFNNNTVPLVFNEFNYNDNIYAQNAHDISTPTSPAVCYEEYSKTNNSDLSLSIPMKKGYFHPNSGWINQQYIQKDNRFNNKTSILTGDGSKKYCKVFKGLGFDEINHDFIDNKIKLYKSSIKLSMSRKAYDPVDGTTDATISADRQEEDDHRINYGYRDLSGSIRALYKYNDEFRITPSISPDAPVPSDKYCDSIPSGQQSVTIGSVSNIEYEYVKPGPIYAPPRPENNQIRYDRAFGRLIGDLEIKLNFLNHINPKELVIWLEIDGPSNLVDKITNEKLQLDTLYYSNIIKRSQCIDFIKTIENENIKKYVNNLFSLNDHMHDKDDIKKISDSKYYLFLINQDHIDMPNYNTIIKFTDNISNDSNNININKYITSDTQQARLNNNIVEINPTISAPGFSDKEIYEYKEIIKNNNLEKYTISKFNKFIGMPLFKVKQPESQRDPPPPPLPDNSSDITFTLNIAVLGECSDGSIYDRIINSENIMNINNAKLKHVSNIQNSSLCSWEIILNNNKSLINFEDKDALGQIDYRSSEPKYLGYNFIGKIPQHLLPPINLDAPNKSLYDSSRCFYSKEKLTAPASVPIPQLNLGLINYTPGFTIVGELVSAASIVDQMNVQARELYNYFMDLRRIRMAEQFNREIYIPKFDRYPTGKSDKALISVSKDNIIWYKLEAGILRYNNCSIIKRKKYFYKHIHHLNEFKDLAKFSLKIIKNVKSLISFKSISIREIKVFNNELKQYELTIETIKNQILSATDNALIDFIKIKSKSINTDIIDTEKAMKVLSDDNKEIPENLSKKLSDLRDIFSQYISIYDSIGPEGIVEDNIIIFERETIIKNQAGEEEKIISYENCTVIKDGILLDLKVFIGLDILLKYNKSLFINNTILRIQKDLKEYLIQTASNEKIEDIVESKIAILDGIRAYSIYTENDTVDVYRPKETLTNAEQEQLKKLNEQLIEPQAKLSKELEKAKVDQDKSLIYSLKATIINIEEQIFSLTHIKSQNIITSKAILKNEQLQTVFIFQNPIKDGDLLIIKPSDNRLIAFDADYIGKDGESDAVNPWSFVNSNKILSEGMSQSIANVFNKGMYGSGSPFTTTQKLYSPEIVNYVKDFIKYIDTNRYINEDFTESYLLYPETESTIQNGAMRKIFTFGSDTEKELIRKYNSYITIENSDAEDDIFGLLDKIMNYEQYNLFFKPDSLKFLIEGSIDNNLSDKIEGYIEFESNINSEVTYGLSDYTNLSKLTQRISQIRIDISNNQDNILKEEDKLSKTQNTNEINTITIKIKTLKDIIYKLRLEFNLISFYLEKLNIDSKTKLSNNEKIIPNISLEVITNSDNSISIQEISNNNYYIINIDAEQGCSIDVDKMPKILTSIEYECLTVLGPLYVDAYRFCPGVNADQLQEGIVGDYRVRHEVNITRYTMLENKIQEFKNKFSNTRFDWERPTMRFSERTFFLNGGSESKGGIVKAKYSYMTPTYIEDNIKPEGELRNKVKDIFNLDNTNNIYIDFKKINRNLRNVDNLYDKYIPSIDGLLVKSLTPPPGGPIDNSLKIWKCYSNRDGQEISLPANFKWMNLVKYLTFYNTYLINLFKESLIDYNIFDINNGTNNIKIRDEMGLIPYDYK